MAQALEKYIIVVPNMIEPYGYELVQIMAFPSGFIYRFRFEEEWVSEKIKNNLPDLNGKNGCIVYRDKEKARFYPIRFIKIKISQKIGKYYYFEYELGNVVELDSDENWRIKQIDDFNLKFSDFHESVFADNNPNQNMKPLVFLSNFELDVKNDHAVFGHDSLDKELERWGNIISTIKSVNFYEDVEFIKIIDMTPMRTPSIAVEAKENSFHVREGEDYKLRVFQLIAKGSKSRSEPKDIKIESDNKFISILRGVQRAVGKYDVLTFIFRINPRSGGERSYLDIIHIPKTEAAQYIDPKLHIPITIHKSIKWNVIRVVIVFLFIVIYAFPGIFDLLSEKLGADVVIDKRIVRDFSLVILTMTFVDLLNEIRDFLRRK